MFQNSRQFEGRWSRRSTRPTVFKREEVKGRGSAWRSISGRCRATDNGGMGGRRRRRPKPFKDWPLSGVLIRFDLHYLSLVRKWSGKSLGGSEGNRDCRSGESRRGRSSGRSEGARARGARTLRHPLTTSKDTSQLGLFLLIQHHPYVQIPEPKGKHANMKRQNVQA